MATLSEAFSAARDLHAAGRLDEAAVLYDRILAVAPDHAQVLCLAGALACQQGRFDAAAPLLERAVAQAPDLAAAHLNLARLRLRAGDGPAAARRIGLCVALDPGDPQAWELSSLVAWQAGRLDDAIAAAARARCVDPRDGGLAERHGLLLCERGRRHLAARRNGAAVADLAHAVRLLPFDVDHAFSLATGLGELGRNAQAADVCRRVLAWSPAEARVLHNLGVALLRTGRNDDSPRVLRRAVAVDPLDSDPCEALAAHFDGRDPVQAVSWSTRALELRLARSAALPPEPAAGDAPPRRTRDIVSFSLWGALEVYCAGAVANARLVPALLPGWTCRFHHDATVPPHILAQLAELGAELVAMPPDSARRQGMFWRFLVADDPTVRRFLCRDCDSRPTPREIAAVRDWIASGLPFHVMRDHVMHVEPVMGGMWGGTGGQLPPIGPAIDRFTDSRTARWNDQHFLGEWLWPRIAGQAMVHDGVHPGQGRPFPVPAEDPGTGHVGAKLLHLVRLPPMDAPDGPGDLAEGEGAWGRLVHPVRAPHVGPSLAELGEWLEIEARLCARLVAPGDVVLDADAGIGAHALALARAVGDAGRIVACADPSGLLECLSRTMAANRADTVLVGAGSAAAWTAFPQAVDPARLRLVRATIAGDPGGRGAGPLSGPLLGAIAAHRPAVHLRIDDDAAGAVAFSHLRALGYRLWWHIAPVFNPGNRRGAVANPFPGLVALNALALPPGREPPPVASLVAVRAGGGGWRDAAWALACDGG